MKLSEAMMLGEIRWARNNGFEWFGKECGCALGRAWYAVGKSSDDRAQEDMSELNGYGFASEWPWLAGNMRAAGISSKFISVVSGKMTFEQLVDYVASIEPGCGDCNRFECSCAKPTEIPVVESESVNA